MKYACIFIEFIYRSPNDNLASLRLVGVNLDSLKCRVQKYLFRCQIEWRNQMSSD